MSELWAKPQTKNCGWRYVLVHVGSVRLTYVYVTLVQMCPLYTSRCSPPEHDVNCEEDHGFSESCVFSLCVITLWHVPHQPQFKKPLTSEPPTRGEVFFTRHCCILWEFIFCPLTKADTGTKLVGARSRSHNKAYWIICTSFAGGEFLSFFMQHIAATTVLISYCISTGYGVDMKIL